MDGWVDSWMRVESGLGGGTGVVGGWQDPKEEDLAVGRVRVRVRDETRLGGKG